MLALLPRGCYKIADVSSAKKVSTLYSHLVARGLMSADEARLLALVDRPRQDDLLVPEAVIPLLLGRIDYSHPGSVGLPYRYQSECGSTNLLLKADAALSATGTLLVTDHQTEGRGRLGRSWSSRPGEDLTFSVLLRPSLPPAEAPVLSLAAALATAEVLESLPGLKGRVRVKWPNDVLIDEKKVCGILLESSIVGAELAWVVAGIGLNVNSDPEARLATLAPAERETWHGRPLPTSLRVALGGEVARGRLLADLVASTAVAMDEHGQVRTSRRVAPPGRSAGARPAGLQRTSGGRVAGDG